MDSRIEVREKPALEIARVGNVEVALYAPAIEYGMWRVTVFRDGKPIAVTFEKHGKYAWQAYAQKCQHYGGVIVAIPADGYGVDDCGVVT